MIEQTLVIVKPDGVQRGLVGNIMSRFETAGLKMVAMKMAWPDKETVGKHYADDPDYYQSQWEKVKKGAEERGEKFTETAQELGTRIREANMRYLSTGPVVVIVLEGNAAIENVRNIIGGTNPIAADVGTIRGDLTIDDFAQADTESRAVRNLMHASGDVDDAKREIELWFNSDEIHDYTTVMDKVLHDPSWGA